MFDLKESDLPELERLAKSGYGWIARDWNEQVYAYTAKPFKNTTTWVGGAKCEKIIGLGINSQIGVRWSDPEPLNIAAAIAQIKAGMKPSGCNFCNGHENDHGFHIDGNVLFYSEGKCGTEGIIVSHCPMCGTPLGQNESKSEAIDD